MTLQDGDIVVFAGDSTTDAEKATTADGLGNGYVRLIRDALYAFRPEEEFRIINAGVSGNTSAHLLARWEKDVLSAKPNVVFCMIGINDVWRHFDGLDPLDARISAEEYAKNLSAICSMTKGVREFIFMTPFYMERSRVDEMRVMTEQYAQEMRSVARSNHVGLVELQPVFDDYMRARSGQTISWDRVHPARVGSMLIARRLWQEFQK